MNEQNELELFERLLAFTDRALAVDGRPTTGDARFAYSSPRRQLVIDISHDLGSAFDTMTGDLAVLQGLHELRRASTACDAFLSVERGSRGELRLAITFPTSRGREPAVRTSVAGCR